MPHTRYQGFNIDCYQGLLARKTLQTILSERRNDKACKLLVFTIINGISSKPNK